MRTNVRIQQIISTFLFFLSIAGASEGLPGESSADSKQFILSGSYLFSLGMINTHGVSGVIGAQNGNHFFGGMLNVALGWKGYDSIRSPDSDPVPMKLHRVMIGLGGLYYYQFRIYRDLLSIDPGFAVGFWMINDVTVKNHYEFFGPRLKINLHRQRYAFFIEPCFLMNSYEITPQVNAGVSLLF
jgi:hypothetical protein